jgi:hypothetical protein
MRGADRTASRIASSLSVGFCGRTIRRVRSVGSTFPALGRWNNPYLITELISTAKAPLHPRPANRAASRSVHSFPAPFSNTACGMRRHFWIGCFGYARVGPPRFTARGPVVLRARFGAPLRFRRGFFGVSARVLLFVGHSGRILPQRVAPCSHRCSHRRRATEGAWR